MLSTGSLVFWLTKQRVVVDGIIETTYVGINKGVMQGTIFVDGEWQKPVDAKNKLFVKFAHDITANAPVKSRLDSVSATAEGISNWLETNRMTLNLPKTWEIVVHSGSTKPFPTPIAGIKRVG